MATLVSDGWDRKASEPRLFRGQTIEWKYIEARDDFIWVSGRENQPLHPDNTYVVRKWQKAWMKIQKGSPAEYIYNIPGTPFSVTSELPDRDKSEWATGRNGKPVDPWRLTEFVHLQGNLSGEWFTFAARFADLRTVDFLCEEISRRRAEHPNASPIVKLTTKADGKGKLPWFEIVGWESDEPAPPIATPVEPKKPPPAPKTKPAFGSSDDDMNDEIPFST